jgi:hypothetical protein
MPEAGSASHRPMRTEAVALIALESSRTTCVHSALHVTNREHEPANSRPEAALTKERRRRIAKPRLVKPHPLRNRSNL